MSRPITTIVAIAALAIALTGCVQTPFERMRLPHPAPTAAFASEEEALAAAVEAYDRFTILGDEVGRDGGRNAERLDAVTAGELLDQTVEGYSQWEENGWHQLGSRSFRDVVLQQVSFDSGSIVVYLCDDVSNVGVVDGGGISVVAPDRPNSNYFQVAFELGEDGMLRVSSRQRWDERLC